MNIDSNIPSGPIEKKWDNHKFEIKLVNPANKRKYTVIVVGTGLAGASAAASLGELGYNVLSFCFQDSPRRAHSIAAQGGINAAKNYQNDGDSVYRLFYDTIKGGDYRSREANVYRLAQVSRQHHRPMRGAGRAVRPRIRRVAGQPFVRRRAGFAHVLRARPDRPAAACSALIGAMMRQVDAGRVKMFTRHEMLELDGRRRRGARHRHARPGDRRNRIVRRRRGRARARGGYGNVYYLSTNAKGCNVTGDLARVQKRRVLRQSLLHADSPDLHSRLRRIPVEADVDARIAAQRRPRLGAEEEGRQAHVRTRFPKPNAIIISNANTRRSAISCRATSLRAPPKKHCEKAAASAPGGSGVYLDFARRDQARLARRTIEEVRQSVRDVQEITGENAYKQPMRIYPAVHYTMGGLWVDYNLMSNIPGLFVLGEANFSDHGANRLGASALMQGLADGYFIIPYTHRRLLGER